MVSHETTPNNSLIQAVFGTVGMESLKSTIEHLVNEALISMRDDHIGISRYKHSKTRNGSSSGFKPRSFKSSRFGSMHFRIPQVRDSVTKFEHGLFKRYQRSEEALCIALSELYIQGVSTRKVTKLYDKLFGIDVSPQSVSNATKRLDIEINEWRTRKITEKIKVIMIDGTYVKVRKNHKVENLCSLIVVGIREDGFRTVLGTKIVNCESEATYSDLFQDLKNRGLDGVKFVVSDSHKGLRKAIDKNFDGALWQRCKVHFMRNVKGLTESKKLKKIIEDFLNKAYYSKTREEALKNKQELVEYLYKND